MAKPLDLLILSVLSTFVLLSFFNVNSTKTYGNHHGFINHTTTFRRGFEKYSPSKNTRFSNASAGNGGRAQQVHYNKTQNTTNELRKRTSVPLKNFANLRSSPRSLRPLQFRDGLPQGRSRSTTFKPIHIYGSVPFKTFLNALSKTYGQGNTLPSESRSFSNPSYPQVSNEPQRQTLPAGGLPTRQLETRQFPGGGPIPQIPQRNFAMLDDGGPVMQPGPMESLPMEGEGMVPYGNPEEFMRNFEDYGLHHHHSTHHLHRQAFSKAKCFPNPCQNGGLCTAFSTSYECTCPLGYKGVNCEEPNQCVPNPCKNGGNCYDDGENYKCTCIKGYNGFNCEEISKCVPNPCKNGATCIENGASYHCECPEHFDGHHCEVHDYCNQDNPCLNGGTCANADQGYECTCRDGYRGHSCAEIDVCHENPCENEGVCKNSGNGQFTCSCGHGFRGIACEEKIPPCEIDPCHNGGSCLEEGDRFVCHCPEHFKGKTCEVPIHTPCSNNPCENGGSCTEMDYGDYKCQCPHDFGGIHCEVQAQPVCYSCHEHATCKNDKCECVDGYTGNGHYCEVVNHCHPNPCYNGGVCHDHSLDYDCVCADGFMGKSCRDPKPCLSSPCQNGGTCIDHIESSCLAGMACTNHGYECTCPLDFVGSNCQHPHPCHPNPCENGGECVTESTTYICQCPIRYTGQKCQEDKCGACDVNGKCEKGKCVCNPGFVGAGTNGTCKPVLGTTQAPTTPIGLAPPRPITPVGFSPPARPTPPIGRAPPVQPPPPPNPCVPNPCQQGGTCTRVGAIDFTCQCPPAFTGKTCTIPVKSYCHPSPCLNGGVCLEIPNGYKCQCIGHFKGTNCQEDECDRCDIRAVCVQGKCKCRVGYSGDGYQCTKIEKCGSCSPHATCKVSKCFCNVGFSGDGKTCTPVGCSDCPSNSKCVYGICVCLPGYFFDGNSCEAPSKSCSSNCKTPKCDQSCPTSCCTPPPPPPPPLPPPSPPVSCPPPCQYQCTNQCPAQCCNNYFPPMG